MNKQTNLDCIQYGLHFYLVLGWFQFSRAPTTVKARIICIQKTLHAQPVERSVDLSSSQNRGLLLHTTSFMQAALNEMGCQLVTQG